PELYPLSAITRSGRARGRRRTPGRGTRMPGNTGTSWVLSWRCPAVMTTESGLNCPQDRHHLRVPQHLCQLSIFPNGGLRHGRFPSLAALTFVLAILYSDM